MGNTIQLNSDNEVITLELEKVGFERHEIGRALEWLAGFSHFTTNQPIHTHSIRHYSLPELTQLKREGCGFLLYLEQIGVLDPISREIAIDRIMALDKNEINLGRIRWVVLLVLFSQPEKKAALSLLQDLTLAKAVDVRH